jgi:hypothetical protein
MRLSSQSTRRLGDDHSNGGSQLVLDVDGFGSWIRGPIPL